MNRPPLNSNNATDIPGGADLLASAKAHGPAISVHTLYIGWGLRLSGSVVRYYLCFQIVAGWLLSAIFLAGVTGPIRRE